MGAVELFSALLSESVLCTFPCSGRVADSVEFIEGRGEVGSEAALPTKA